MYRSKFLTVTVLCAVLSIPSIVNAAGIFSYDLSVQAETSLDQGPVVIQGKVFNSGSLIIDLSPQAGWTEGFDGLNSSCAIGDALDCVFDSLNGQTLAPGETVSFEWFAGSIDQDVSFRSGSTTWLGLLFVPLDSDWYWNGNPVPDLASATEPRVETTWVNGAVDQLVFDTETYDLETFRDYIITPSPVPIPASIWLFTTGLISLVSFARRKTNA